MSRVNIMFKKGDAKCSEKELKILGDFWTLAIIQALSDSSKRFSELQREQKINPTTLTNRLKKLDTLNFINRSEETLDRLSVVYSLTKKGKGILPVLNQIKKFSEKYL